MTPADHQAIPEAAFRFALHSTLAPSLIDVGTGCLALTGYPPDDFVAGRVTLQDRIHPDDRDIAHLLFTPDSPPADGSCNLRVRQVFVRTRTVKDPEGERRAQDAAARLRAGEDFDTVRVPVRIAVIERPVADVGLSAGWGSDAGSSDVVHHPGAARGQTHAESSGQSGVGEIGRAPCRGRV